MDIVMAIAKFFKEHSIIPKYNLKIIGFYGEDRGHKGAIYYAANHSKENITYLINLN